MSENRQQEAFNRLLEDKYNDLSVRGTPLFEVIDDFCESIAKILGTVISEEPRGLLNPDHLGWIFGQYRGTAISGKRKLGDYYYRDNLGSELENDYLLETYWQVYGLGSSIGELFYRQIQRSDLYGQPATKWYSLQVTLAKQQELSLNKAQPHVVLSVPDHWLDILVPGDLFERFRQKIEETAVKPEPKERQQRVEEFLDRDCFRASLIRNCNRLVAEILAGWQHNERSNGLSVALDFFQGTEKRDEATLEKIVQATQLLALYWRWSQHKRETVGDLLVVFPVPGRDMIEMPRWGLALLYTGSHECASKPQAGRITEFLNNTLVPRLRVLARRWSEAAGARRRELRKVSRFLDSSSGRIDELKKRIMKARQESEADSTQLLLRLLPVLEEISRLAPSFIHEGHRYAVDVLLGVPYHEQVVGHKLASLDKDKTQYRDQRTPQHEVNILGPIISSSYSLLDSQEIVLFGKISPRDGEIVEWTSMLKLRGQGSLIPSVRRYEALTEGHGNLFAITVGKDSKLRLFANGTLLLEYWQNQWFSGTSTEDLENKLKDQLGALGIGVDEGKELSKFAGLVQRISETPGAGTLLVITRHQSEVDRLKEVSAPPSDFWREKTLADLLDDPDDTLYRLATMDGATAVLIEGDVLDLNKARVFPRRLISEEYDLECFKQEWMGWDWLECLSYGSRRASGLALAMQSYFREKQKKGGACLCIVVSTDGPIYLMRGGSEPITRIPPKD